MTFRLLAGGTCSPRAGVLDLAHGSIDTPAFMPVGTRGAVKALDMTDVARLAPGMILANTFHLWNAPGEKVVARAGGLHAWNGWQGNLLTDSGGYQAVSLARVGRATVTEAGVAFGADGSRLLTPEDAIAIQEQLAPDVMMALDQPVAYGAPAAEFAAATARTHRWARRCRDAWTRGRTDLWGIVQGGFDVRARRASADFTAGLDLPGYAVGGLSLGEPGAQATELIAACTSILPADRPRYLMGVGSEPEMLAAISVGIDLFDCVLPTRLARTGAALVGPRRVNLLSSRYAEDGSVIEPGCGCETCATHGRAQVRHLLRRGELLGYRLLTIHNLHHTLELARLARTAILSGAFDGFVRARLEAAGDSRAAADRSI